MDVANRQQTRATTAFIENLPVSWVTMSVVAAETSEKASPQLYSDSCLPWPGLCPNLMSWLPGLSIFGSSPRRHRYPRPKYQCELFRWWLWLLTSHRSRPSHPSDHSPT